jgi:hypothetical protein
MTRHRLDMLMAIDTIDGDIGLEHIPMGVLQGFAQQLGKGTSGTRQQLVLSLRHELRLLPND